MMTEHEYLAARAICDKATAYWQANATFSKDGWSSLDAAKAAHPDYAACSNELRGMVEQHELFRDKPARFSAYVSSDEQTVTCWPGNALGKVTSRTLTKRRSDWQGKVYSYRARTSWGKVYQGYGAAGCLINLREARS